MIVYIAGAVMNARYPFAYPAIDGIGAGIIMTLATRPNYSGRAPLIFVAILLFVQASFQLSVTAYGYYYPERELNIYYLAMFGMNRLFEVILISIWLIAVLRIIRMRQPELHQALWRMAGLLPLSDSQSNKVEFAARDEFDRHIGAKLVEARRNRGWSSERLASECALPVEEMAQYESGRKPVPPSTLLALGKLLGVRMRYFTDGLESAS